LDAGFTSRRARQQQGQSKGGGSDGGGGRFRRPPPSSWALSTTAPRAGGKPAGAASAGASSGAGSAGAAGAGAVAAGAVYGSGTGQGLAPAWWGRPPVPPPEEERDASLSATGKGGGGTGTVGRAGSAGATGNGRGRGFAGQRSPAGGTARFAPRNAPAAHAAPAPGVAATGAASDPEAPRGWICGCCHTACGISDNVCIVCQHRWGTQPGWFCGSCRRTTPTLSSTCL